MNNELKPAPAWACPTHHRKLSFSNGVFVCPEGEQYPVVTGIPRFVEGSTYADAFGLQWNKYRVTQLDSYTGQPISRDRLCRCLGDTLWESLSGKDVLECGCGAGRFTQVLLSQGGRVTSIDLSSAVNANQQNCPLNNLHRIAQADIHHLPFAPGQYDIVLCLGVVQHTSDPESTVAKLWEQVKPGGALVIDHYRYNLSWYTKTAPLFRMWLRRMEPMTGIQWTERLTKLFFPMHRAARKSRLLQRLISRISPLLCYYHNLPQLPDRLQYEWAMLDTHDSLTAWYKHYRTRGQIRRVLESLGGEAIWCKYGGNGVEARAIRKQSFEKTAPANISESAASIA